MYRFHPQWQKAKTMIDEGLLGEVKTIHAFFSYFNIDAGNIRNQPEAGGGALMDIGCYCISFPRYIFGSEPQQVVSLIDRDPVMQTDRITSGIFGASFNLIVNRFTGPGKIGIQSMYVHYATET